MVVFQMQSANFEQQFLKALETKGKIMGLSSTTKSIETILLKNIEHDNLIKLSGTLADTNTSNLWKALLPTECSENHSSMEQK